MTLDKELIADLLELMDALNELAYGVMLTTGQTTATKVISSTYKVKITLEKLDAI